MMSAKNVRVQTPPQPFSQRSEIYLPTLPLVIQNLKLANAPSPLERNHIVLCMHMKVFYTSRNEKT